MASKYPSVQGRAVPRPSRPDFPGRTRGTPRSFAANDVVPSDLKAAGTKIRRQLRNRRMGGGAFGFGLGVATALLLGDDDWPEQHPPTQTRMPARHWVLTIPCAAPFGPIGGIHRNFNFANSCVPQGDYWNQSPNIWGTGVEVRGVHHLLAAVSSR